MDWLADHGANATDDVFLPAALTARLIIELTRFSNRLRDVVKSDAKLFGTERGALHAEVQALRTEIEAMRCERTQWVTEARTSVIRAGADAASDIERRVDAAITNLSAALDEPIAPISAAIAGLPEIVRSAASSGAKIGVESTETRARIAFVGWLRSRSLIGISVIIVLVVLAFAIGRTTAPKTTATSPSTHHANTRPHR